MLMPKLSFKKSMFHAIRIALSCKIVIIYLKRIINILGCIRAF